VAQMVQQVQNAMHRLQSDWIGRGSEAFFHEMEGELLPALNRLVGGAGPGRNCHQRNRADDAGG
jgi:hypothetical protein